MNCPFCDKEMKFETIERGSAIMVMFCENDKCNVKPCTDYGTPSEVIAEASQFGKIKNEIKSEFGEVKHGS